MENFLTAHWGNLIMANYAIDPVTLQPFLPVGVELDLYQGNAYVSLVGFLFSKVRIFGIPVPFFGKFEEVNLRFYVIRKLENSSRRGVVFINETVPNRLVAWIANKLYKEHYISIPTRHQFKGNENQLSVRYEWKTGKVWNHISAVTEARARSMNEESIEEFIYEHYFGYTKVSEAITEEYRIHHTRWSIHNILSYQVDCDFAQNYGDGFKILQNRTPDSVMMAEGSNISVKWNRVRI